MAAQITNYQCPACTGPLHFVGASGKLECDYCGTHYQVEEIEALYADKDKAAAEAAKEAEKREEARTGENSGEEWDMSGLNDDWGADGEGMKAYSCPSCSAELICDESTAATSCPYCNNPTIVPGKFDGALKPDYVIPFKLDKKAAIAALKKHYEGKVLLPKRFISENHIEEIQGVYVPFWLFDGKADADITFDATRSHSHRSGNERITITEHYKVRRAGTVDFEKIPVDASSKMPDTHMDAIEPFNYDELKPFSNAYLPGYLANKYDVSVEDCAKRADKRATQSAYDAMRNSVTGYETCSATQKYINLERGQVKYALLPVYMLNTKWNGEDYLFAMNGQTGRLIGNLPIAWGKFWAWFIGIAAPVAAITAWLVL
ncbi:MAG: hypothetical protein IKL51_01955 [Lachnospiraceae bacterium]|nr:hypothetical protein [Lachnospiraceae bacterium]